MTTCPKCAEPLAGLATYCFRCEAYTEDLRRPNNASENFTEASTGETRDIDNRTEEEISLAIRAVLELHGFDVYSLEQGYRKESGGTRQTAGLPDLFVVGFGRALWVELKSAKGRLRPSQEAFRDVCEANAVGWALWRSEADAIEWAREAREAAA